MYVENELDENIFNSIRTYYQNQSLENCVFVTNEFIVINSAANDIAFIHPYYVSWTSDTVVVFIDPKHVQKTKDMSLNKKVLLIKKQDIRTTLSAEIISLCDEILVLDKNKVRSIKNAELQQFNR